MLIKKAVVCRRRRFQILEFSWYT